MKNNIDKKFLKNFIWNIIGTSFNSFNSLFFLIIVTWINGRKDAGVFVIGSAISLILYTIGEYSGRICQVTDTENKITDKDYIFNRFITSFSVVVISIFIVLIRKYNLYKSAIIISLCIFRALEAFSEILYGIMQKYGKLYKAGQSYTIKSGLGLLIFFIIDKLTYNLFLACASLGVIYILVIIFFDFYNIKKLITLDYKVNLDNVKMIFKKEFFVFANSFAGVYILNSQKYAIDVYFTDNIQAIYGYIMMPASIINLFTKFVIMPFLNEFKELIKILDIKKLRNILFKIKSIIIFFGIICIILALIMGPEILGIIYKSDLTNYRINLCLIIFAYILYSLSYLDLVVLTTTRNNLIQFIIYIFSMIIAFISSQILIKRLEINGATISCILTLGTLFILYTIINNVILNRLQRDEK